MLSHIYLLLSQFFLDLVFVLLLTSLCTAVLPANFSQGGSIKEHLISYLEMCNVYKFQLKTSKE